MLIATKLAGKNNPEFSEIVRILINAGADPKLKDKTGWGPLDEAISHVFFIILIYFYV